MALDSFIGEGLSMSPYQEVVEAYNKLMKQHTDLLDKYAVLVKKFIDVNDEYDNALIALGWKREAGDLP